MLQPGRVSLSGSRSEREDRMVGRIRQLAEVDLDSADYKSDDNRDDSRTPDNAHNCPPRVVFCLVTRFASSAQCGGQGFGTP